MILGILMLLGGAELLGYWCILGEKLLEACGLMGPLGLLGGKVLGVI